MTEPPAAFAAVWWPDADMLLRLGVATALGLLLGAEREWRGNPAGLRTHALLSLSSALITLSGIRLVQDIAAAGGESDPLRVVQGIAQALGFIAAGLVFVSKGDVRNLTTAVNLWLVAGIGVAAGAGQIGLAATGTLFALLLLTVMRVVARLLSGRHRERAEED